MNLRILSLIGDAASVIQTSPDRERWGRHAQLLGWMMDRQDSGPQSRLALYLLQQHQRSPGIPDLQLGSAAGADGALTSEQIMEASPLKPLQVLIF